MLKAMKYRIYPTKSQINRIEKYFGSTRFLYNYFLNYRQNEYKKGNKVNYLDTQSELTKLKELDEYEWLKDCGSQSLQVALRELDSAFTKFFNKQGGYPKFKSKKYSHHATLKRATISRHNNKYYISILTEDNIPVPKLTESKRAVGLDMGIAHRVITSDGTKYPNNRYYNKSQKRLTTLQRRLSKKQKDSKNRQKACSLN